MDRYPRKSYFSNLVNGTINYLSELLKNEKDSFRVGRFGRIYLKHAPVGKKQYYKLLGKKLAFVTGYELLHALDEIFEEEIYKIKLPSKPTIIDCGANIGLSVIYLKLQSPDAHVIAFEPDTRNYELL